MTGVPRILFGIGAQKAGTSWLHAYLSAHPECHVPLTKELHYFDDIYGPERHRFLSLRLERMREIILSARPEGPDEDLSSLAALVGMHGGRADNAHARYLDLLLDGHRGQAIAADCTPSYALAGPEGFRAMCAVAPGARFLFILRDPVERLWSAIRMNVWRQRLPDGPGLDAGDHARRVLDGAARNHALRSDYAATLEALDVSVPAGSVHVEFYETLFTPDAVARICRFLGIGYRDADFARRVHEGEAMLRPDWFDARAFDWLRPVYEKLEARFGAALPASWRRTAEVM